MRLSARLCPDPLGNLERSPGGPIAVRQTALWPVWRGAGGEAVREYREERTGKKGTGEEKGGKGIGGEMDVSSNVRSGWTPLSLFNCILTRSSYASEVFL